MEVDYFFLNLLLISTLFILSKPISNIVKISDFPEKEISKTTYTTHRWFHNLFNCLV